MINQSITKKLFLGTLVARLVERAPCAVTAAWVGFQHVALHCVSSSIDIPPLLVSALIQYLASKACLATYERKLCEVFVLSM